MSSAICTLFEGNYHFGLAALTNTLYREGYRGSIYAGYRGNLPPWATGAKESLSLNWPDSKTLPVADGLQLHFLPLETDYHLTNYKPDFMLRIWDGPAANATKIFYFDPDIVLYRAWDLFEEWVNCGVALSEDINSPLSKNHPRRVAWRRYFGENGIELSFKDDIYVNGGFIGLNRENRSFLDLWKKLQETMAPLIGGLNCSIFRNGDSTLLDQAGGAFQPFYKTDQDALNAAIEAYDKEISFMGKEGMGFGGGFILMIHALGRRKPWKWKPLMQVLLAGRPPRLVDFEYWNSVSYPITSIPGTVVYRHKLALKIASTIGRFYKRDSS